MSSKSSTSDRFTLLERASIALRDEVCEERIQFILVEAAQTISGTQFAALIVEDHSQPEQSIALVGERALRLAATQQTTTEQEQWLQSLFRHNDTLAALFKQATCICMTERKDDKLRQFLRDLTVKQENHSSPQSTSLPLDVLNTQIPVRSLLGVSLLESTQAVLGYLFVGAASSHQFLPEERALLISLAAQASMALERTQVARKYNLYMSQLPFTIEELASNASLQNLFDEVPSGILILAGYDARIIIANRAASSTIGTSWYYQQPLQEAIENSKAQFLDRDNRPLSFEQLSTVRALRTGESLHGVQEIIHLANGLDYAITINATVLTNDHWLKQLIQCTYNLDKEERLVIVAHQNASIFAEAEYAKEEFIVTAAHELRSPLAVLRGCAQMLITKSGHAKGKALTEWQTEALQSIQSSTVYMSEIVDKLLDLSSLQANHLKIHLEPCDLVAIARRVVNNMQQTTDQHHFVLSTVANEMVVVADMNRLEQVLINIINNALKFSPQGGDINVSITAHQEAKADDTAIISIQDHGIGIPKQQQQRIFQRFQRADNAQDISGIGLALYLCRALIHLQKGQIWFTSQEGQGTTFYISLPLEQVEHEQDRL